MKLYARGGQQAAALRQYQECVCLLDGELGIPPEAATISLYKAIKSRQFPDSEDTLLPLLAIPAFMTDEHERAEPDAGMFVGRLAELERLQAVLDTANRNQGQVIFAIGGVGRGKTALVQAFVRQVLAANDDWLVVCGKRCP
ncbi:MAG: hypothetical protein GY796_29175 [Chloroflexi bacterium]|nr:hypothetical protein [Chloroflexota bacterium]